MNETEATYILDTSALLNLIVESTASLSVTAARLKAKHRISVADAWIAALALERNAVLIHKDPEFEQTEDEFKVLKLPYKD